jgi:hypothetical protein
MYQGASRAKCNAVGPRLQRGVRRPLAASGRRPRLTSESQQENDVFARMELKFKPLRGASSVVGSWISSKPCLDLSR